MRYLVLIKRYRETNAIKTRIFFSQNLKKLEPSKITIHFSKEIGFPYIVKPVDSRGTFGVTIVKDNSNAKEAYFHAVMNSTSKRIICEEFIDGTLVTVDGFCFSNGHKSLTVASRVFDDGPHR